MDRKIGFDDDGLKLGFFTNSLRLAKLSIVDAFLRMFDFTGRTSRAPYWIATIIFGLCSVFSMACSIWSLGWNLGDFQYIVRHLFKVACYLFLFLLASLFVRRNHDLGESIRDIFNPFNIRNNTPFLGTTVWDLGDPEANEYGPPHTLW